MTSNLARFVGRSAAQVFRKLLHRRIVADLQHQLVLRDFFRHAGEALERHHRVIAIDQRTRILVDVLGLLFADFKDPGVDFGVGHFRLVIGDGEAAIFAQLELGRDFELGFEGDRLAGVKVHVADVGLADHFQVILVGRGTEEARDQLFENILADISGEALLHQTHRSLARTESRQLYFFLNFEDDALGFLFHLDHGDGDFERVLATFD